MARGNWPTLLWPELWRPKALATFNVALRSEVDSSDLWIAWRGGATGTHGLALMDRNLQTLRNVVLSALNSFVSRRFAWQLSGVVYRGSP